MTNLSKIDSVLAFIFVKSIITNPMTTKAFELGLIDDKGRVIKSPETDDEHAALTVLDRLGFKIRRLLSSKLSELSSFAYVKTTDAKYQKLLSTNDVEKKALIKRVKQDLLNLSEKHDLSVDDMMRVYLAEELKES